MVVRIGPSCLSLSQQYGHKQLGFRRNSRRACIRRPQTLPSAIRDGYGLRVFVISDLHSDYPENMKWVNCLSATKYRKDVLLVAGDVAETYKNFVLTMSLLRDRFQHVLYVPGNHDLWCRGEEQQYRNSLEKLNKLLEACGRLGVDTNPMVIDGLGIVPLFSWYHESFDREEDVTGVHIPLEMACKDFHACKWPGELSSRDSSLAFYFDAMNDNNQDVIDEIKQKCTQIITFSHFVPRFVGWSYSCFLVVRMESSSGKQAEHA